jgi:hypothetical protein
VIRFCSKIGFIYFISPNINQWENYYAFREGIVCGNYVIDSTLIESEYREYEYLLSLDTVFISHTVDTLNLGVTSFSMDKWIKVFPNPVKDYLTIVVGGVRSEIEVCMIDAFNREIMGFTAERDTDYNIDLKYYPKGIYFLQFRNDNKFETIKILRN